MPSTASGTAYTTRISTATGYGTTAMTVADAHFGDANIPTVLYCHGASGAYDQFASLSAWQGLRDWLIDNGCAIIEGAGEVTDAAGLTNWGNDNARLAYPAYVTYWAGTIDIGALCPVGRSMGELAAAWFFTQSAFAGQCVGHINNSGVSTINTPPGSSERTASYFGSSFRPAYGAADNNAAVIASFDHDPVNWSASVWDGKKVLTLWGDADPIVPYATRGAGPLRAVFAGHPALDLTDIRAGGDHTGPNGSYNQVSAMTSFLTLIGFVTPPAPPADQFIVSNAAWLYTGGGFHVLSPVF